MTDGLIKDTVKDLWEMILVYVVMEYGIEKKQNALVFSPFCLFVKFVNLVQYFHLIVSKKPIKFKEQQVKNTIGLLIKTSRGNLSGFFDRDKRGQNPLKLNRR